jgi:hypothetical protein
VEEEFAPLGVLDEAETAVSDETPDGARVGQGCCPFWRRRAAARQSTASIG